MSITAQETNPAPGSGACPISARHTPRISGGVLPRPRGQHGLRRPLNVSLLAFVAAARSHRHLSRTSSYAADRSGVDQTVFKAPLAKMFTALLECPGSPERRSLRAQPPGPGRCGTARHDALRRKPRRSATRLQPPRTRSSSPCEPLAQLYSGAAHSRARAGEEPR